MAKKEIQPYEATDRLGILNPYGDIWTPRTFDNEDEARRYLVDFWNSPGFPPTDLKKFKIIPVRVVVSALAH